MRNNDEYILCAANHYDDLNRHEHQPKNVMVGYVICGHRHFNCISTFAQMVGFPYSKESMKIMRTEIQGFLTSTNRFVSREQALEIAIEAGQIKQPGLIRGSRLYSEDLY
jgi:hypothetical protein